MSVIGEIHASLDAIGFEQQACMFVFLMSYPLVLGRLLQARERRIAGVAAGTASLGFVVLTDPWVHAVVLVVIGIGGLGVFIAAVYVADRVSRRIAWRGLSMREDPPAAEATTPASQPGRGRVPIRSTVPVKP